MLRECHRVLRTGGHLAAAAIEVVDGLSSEQRDRALALGPKDVGASSSLRSMVEQVGFHLVTERDVTSDFAVSIAQRLDALARTEAQLRREEGDEAVEVERDKRSRMLTGVREGLLRRTMIVGRAR